MKYFTLKWWNDTQECPDSEEPSQRYDEYFQSVKELLPDPFIQMHERIFLHDGELRDLRVHTEEKTLALTVHTDDGSGGLKVVYLSYFGVTSFISFATPEEGLPGPLGYGDWGYDEVEVKDVGYEHRILFSSGIQMSICFSNIEMTY